MKNYLIIFCTLLISIKVFAGERPTPNQDMYITVVVANTNYQSSRNECFRQKNDEFAKFSLANILVENQYSKNRLSLMRSKKLLSPSDWATYSWYYSSVSKCIKDLQSSIKGLPTDIKDIYQTVQNAEDVLVEQLRLRKVSVGLYNEVRYFLSIEEDRDIQNIIRFYKRAAEDEKYAKDTKLPPSNIQPNPSQPMLDNRLSNAAFATALCSIFTGGKTAGCAAGALDPDESNIDSRLNKQKKQIEDIKLQQLIDKSNREFREIQLDSEKRRSDLNDWRPGQR